MSNFMHKRVKIELKCELDWLGEHVLVKLNVNECFELNLNKTECVNHN